jgi:hypothetical protein
MASRFIPQGIRLFTSFDISNRISNIGIIMVTEKTVNNAESRLNRKFRINCLL